MRYSWGPSLRALHARENRSIAGAVYERLRGDIVSGRLKPDERLLSEVLKERYGVGSSPLREALSHLAAEGLVRAESQKGFRVADVSLREFVDLSRQRLRLESRALADSIRWGDVDWEVEIVSRYHRLRHALARQTPGEKDYADDWEASHRAFHFALIDGCGSPWLISFCEKLYDQMERYRRVFVSYRDIASDLLEAHEALKTAAIARDTTTALALLGEHVMRASELTERDMRAQGIWDADSVPGDLRRLLSEELLPERRAEQGALQAG